jgi:hypothetical protein
MWSGVILFRMPAKPSYSHRLPECIAILEGLAADWIDRRQLEEILGVSKTVAWRVLRQCGAEYGPGGSLMCRRQELVSQLRTLRDGGSHEREIRRRDRLEGVLAGLRPAVVAKLTKVVTGDEAIVGMLSTTFRKLPANVVLTPSSLHIEFGGAEEFLKAVGAVVYALQNDYEEIRVFLEEGSGDRPARRKLVV